MKQKKLDQAIAFTSAIQLNTNYAEAYVQLGLAEYYSGKKDAACTRLQQAVKLNYPSAAGAIRQICK